jgi:prepilin-type N-terminal cleavage/methylation domain-containing protein
MWNLRIQSSKKDDDPLRTCQQDSTKGFTLVEVIVAAAILGTTFIAVFAAMRTCSAAAHHARMLTRSVLLAESLLTEAMLSENTVFETKEGQEERYRWKVEIVPTPVDDLGAIRVQVRWLEQGREQQYELFSLVQMRVFTERG